MGYNTSGKERARWIDGTEKQTSDVTLVCSTYPRRNIQHPATSLLGKDVAVDMLPR